MERIIEVRPTDVEGGNIINRRIANKRLYAELGVLARRHGGAAQELLDEVEQELIAFYTEVDHAKATYRNNGKAFYSGAARDQENEAC